MVYRQGSAAPGYLLMKANILNIKKGVCFLLIAGLIMCHFLNNS